MSRDWLMRLQGAGVAYIAIGQLIAVGFMRSAGVGMTLFEWALWTVCWGPWFVWSALR